MAAILEKGVWIFNIGYTLDYQNFKYKKTLILIVYHSKILNVVIRE